MCICEKKKTFLSSPEGSFGILQLQHSKAMTTLVADTAVNKTGQDNTATASSSITANANLTLSPLEGDGINLSFKCTDTIDAFADPVCFILYSDVLNLSTRG